MHLEGAYNQMNACEKNPDLVIQLAKEQLYLSQIARRVGTNKRYVKKFLIEHNIPYRKPSWSGKDNPKWNGGEIIDKDGYILVLCLDHPNKDRHGYVRKHRLVVEKKLGRFLLPSEVVHHIDGNKKNNSQENLEVFEKNSDHLRAELTGKIPEWTDDGFRRMLEGSRKPRPRKQISNQSQ
jgi:hypothetical protein